MHAFTNNCILYILESRINFTVEFVSNDFNETNNQMHLKIVKTSGRCHLFHVQDKHMLTM